MATRYWTVAEQNALSMPVNVPLLVNRALWLAVGFGVLAYGIARFRFAQFAREDAGARTQATAAGAQAPSLAARLRLPEPRRSFGAGARLAQLRSDDARRHAAHPARGVVLDPGGAVRGLRARQRARRSAASTARAPIPSPTRCWSCSRGRAALFGIIIITIYAGELVWEERETGSAQIHDSLPVPSWVPFVAKTLALSAMMAVLLAVAMLTGMLIQAAHGYFEFEPWLYVRELFGLGLPMFVLMIVLAMTVQSLVNHKYVGHLIVILYWVLWSWLGFMLVPHNLVAYPSARRRRSTRT